MGSAEPIYAEMACLHELSPLALPQHVAEYRRIEDKSAAAGRYAALSYWLAEQPVALQHFSGGESYIYSLPADSINILQVDVSHGTGEAFVTNTLVHPELRRHDIATRMLQACVRGLADEGIGCLHAEEVTTAGKGLWMHVFGRRQVSERGAGLQVRFASLDTSGWEYPKLIA